MAYKDQCHRTYGIHFEVEKETDFFEHFPVKKMRFIHNDDWLQMMNAAHELNFPV